MKFCSECGISMKKAKPFDGGLICPMTKNFLNEKDLHIFWDNPKPVGVALIPKWIESENQFGLIVGKRSKGYKSGGWAFPCGFMLTGETSEEATAREAYEEIYVKVKEGVEFTLLGVRSSTPNSKSLMVFYGFPPESFIEEKFVINSEVSEKSLFTLTNDIDLCFSTHQEIGTNYLKDLNKLVQTSTFY